MNDKERIINLEKRIEQLEALANRLCNEKESPDTEEKASAVVASYDFSKEECRQNSGWKICNAENVNSDDALCFKAMQVERTLGVFCDPMLINLNMKMPADDIKQVHVRIKSNVDATQRCMLRVFFTTEKSPEWSQSKSVDNYYPAGRKVDVYVDTKNRYWTGNLNWLRIDPVEGLRGSIEMDLIELLDSQGNVKYKVDFTKAENLESTGWSIKNTSFVRCNGNLMFDVDMLEKKRVFTDPFIVIKNVEFDAQKSKFIHIKMRADIENHEGSDPYMQILFKTKESDFWTQEKCMRFSYKACEDVDAFIEIKQLFWKGTVNALRIDPFEKFEGVARIKLIEILSEIPKDVNIDLLEARTRHLEDRFNRRFN